MNLRRSERSLEVCTWHGGLDAELVIGRYEPVTPALAARHIELLDDVERERAARFARAQDRHLFVFAHALLRVTLARWLGISPRMIPFTAMARGRPELAPAAPIVPVRFNLSHSEGMVACVVTPHVACGVDVESLDSADYRDLVDLALAPTEARALEGVSEGRRADRFFRAWTLKEAYLKGLGLGLSVWPRDLVFCGQRAQLHCHVSTGPAADAPGAWRFWTTRLRPRHRLAVALRTGGSAAALSVIEVGPDLRIRGTRRVRRL